MFRNLLLRLVLVGMVVVGVLALTAENAHAGWHHARYAGYYGYYYAPSYASTYNFGGYTYAPYVNYRYTNYYSDSFSFPRQYWLGGYHTQPNYFIWGGAYSPTYYGTGCCGTYSTSTIGYYYYRPVYRTCCRPRCYTYYSASCCAPVATAYYYDPAVSCCGSTVVTQPAAPVAPSPAPAPPAPAPAPPAPLAPPAPADAAPELPSVLPPAPADASIGSRDSATLAVRVPADAKVYINGRSTSTPGDYRQYVSNGLVSGYHYTYQVQAEVIRNGRRLTDSRTVHMTAGDRQDVAFDFQSSQLAAGQVPTTLPLRVPEDAKVTLEGQATYATGAVRSFTTTELAPGATWKNYDVVVTVDRFGQTMTREQSITLVGGQPADLQINFDAAQVATR